MVRLVGCGRARSRARGRRRFPHASRGYLFGTGFAGICFRFGSVHWHHVQVAPSASKGCWCGMIVLHQERAIYAGNVELSNVTLLPSLCRFGLTLM